MQQWLKTQFAKGFHVYHLGLTMIPWGNRHSSSPGGKKESGFAKLNREEFKYGFIGDQDHCFIILSPSKKVGQD